MHLVAAGLAGVRRRRSCRTSFRRERGRPRAELDRIRFGADARGGASRWRTDGAPLLRTGQERSRSDLRSPHAGLRKRARIFFSPQPGKNATTAGSPTLTTLSDLASPKRSCRTRAPRRSGMSVTSVGAVVEELVVDVAASAGVRAALAARRACGCRHGCARTRLAIVLAAVDVAAEPRLARHRARRDVLGDAARQLAEEAARAVPARRAEDLAHLRVRHDELPCARA